jgi:hypothetical protein
VAHAGRPIAKLVPYSGEPTRPGLVRTQIVVEDIVVLGGDRRVWGATRGQYPRQSSSGST